MSTARLSLEVLEYLLDLPAEMGITGIRLEGESVVLDFEGTPEGNWALDYSPDEYGIVVLRGMEAVGFEES